MNKKNKLGLITGSGPEAGIDLWKKILEANKEFIGNEFRGDIDAPHVVIHSVPELGLSMDIHRHKKQVRESLLETVEKISKDVDFFAIACNTLHYFSKDIRQLNPPAEFVSIVDAVTDYIKKENIKRVALLGSKYGMDIKEDGIYLPLLDFSEIMLPKDLNEVHQLVYDIKRLGPDDDSVKFKFLSIINQFDVEDVLLACTELPLIKPKLPGINFIDSTNLLAWKLIYKVHSTSQQNVYNK